MFLEQQISVLELFLKDHVTLKTGVMMLKMQLCHHINNFNIFKKFFFNILNIYCTYLHAYLKWVKDILNI